MPPVMSYVPATWPAIAVSLLSAALKLTVSPCALNRPLSSATKKPAESTAGTTATFSTGFPAGTNSHRRRRSSTQRSEPAPVPPP